MTRTYLPDDDGYGNLDDDDSELEDDEDEYDSDLDDSDLSEWPGVDSILDEEY